MGSQLSVTNSYSLGEALEYESDIWELYPALRREDDEEFTVFLHNKESPCEGVDIAIKCLRTIRHPGMVKCHEVFNQMSEVVMVVEPVIPLANIITDLHTLEVIAGIQHLIQSIAFIHDQCKMSHNNLSIASIFVGQHDACWKIAGFENISFFADIAKEKLMNESLAHARDALAFGNLICEIFEQVNFSVDDMSISHFIQRVKEDLVEATVEKRPVIKSLLNDEIFQAEYCQILDFLQHLPVKTNSEKSSFFSTLHLRLNEVPSHLIANRLLHLLLSRFVLLDPMAVEAFLPHLLTPILSGDNQTLLQEIQPILPEDLFKSSCIPILQQLFEVKDRHVRLILLQHFQKYVAMFEKDFLKSDILPELRLSLQDSDDELVSTTISAMQHLVPILGAHVIIGGQRNNRFPERRPKMACSDTNISSTVDKPAQAVRHMTSQVKPRGNLDDKKLERERKREEMRQRNEERRKQRERLKLEKKNGVQGIGSKFDSVENVRNDELNVEVSDDSDAGRPSSSEISIDSGFSEKSRNAIKMIPLDSKAEEPLKFCKEKKTFGMNLCKDNKERQSGGKAIALKELARLHEKQKIIDEEDKRHLLREGINKDISQVKDDLTSNSDKNHEIKKIERKKINAVVQRSSVVDKAWDEFDINIKKSNIVEDIFAGMAPTLSETRKAPVKGRSIYSDNLSVVNNGNQEDFDGWEDDDW